MVAGLTAVLCDILLSSSCVMLLSTVTGASESSASFVMDEGIWLPVLEAVINISYSFFTYIYQNIYVFTCVIYLCLILSILGLSSNNLRIKFFLESQSSGKCIAFLWLYLRFESKVSFETFLSTKIQLKTFPQCNHNLSNVEPNSKKSKFCY